MTVRRTSPFPLLAKRALATSKRATAKAAVAKAKLPKPFKLTAKRATTELDVARLCVDWLRLALPAGSVVAVIPNETRALAKTEGARARFYAARTRAGVLSGMPDCLCALPGGRVLFVEFKRPVGGVLSDAQKSVHAQLVALSHSVVVATCVDHLDAMLRRMGIEPRIPVPWTPPLPLKVKKPRVAARKAA